MELPVESDTVLKTKCKKKFTIESVTTRNNEEMEPCLVKFSNGTLKTSTRVTGQLYRNGNKDLIRRQKDRILKVKGPHLTYTGRNFGVEHVNPFKERLFVGVLDRSKKKMHLYETNSFLVNYESAVKESSSNQENLEESFADREKTLQECFGGKRGRSIARKIMEKRVDVSKMTTALQDALQDVTPIKEEERSKEGNEYEHILPPNNREASKIDDVYQLDDIIGENELLYFNDLAVSCLGDTSTCSDYSQLFKISLANSKFLDSESEQAKAVCVALYVEQLIAVINTRARQTPDLKQCPKAIISHIKGKFLEGKLRKPNKVEEDKIATHIIVLSLLLNKFQVPLTAFCQSIKIKKDKLQILIQIVGAHYMKDSGNVILKLPLKTFKPPNLSRSRRN